jgi:hypothetical protein
MKLKRCFFLIAAVAGILCSFALAAAESPQSDTQGMDLFGHTDVALAGMQEVNVFIEYPDKDPNVGNLQWKQIQDQIKSELKTTGLKIASEHYQEVKATAWDIPELIISLEIFRLDDSQRCLLHIQTFLSRKVYPAKEHRWAVKADVWKSKPVMQLVLLRTLSFNVPSLLLGQISEFNAAYMQANPAGAPAPEAKDAAINSLKESKEHTRTAVEPPAVGYEYVSPKNSKIFHKSTCGSARRITSENLVGYSSREEAIEAGKIPCKRCKP